MTGSELLELRKAANLSQGKLASMIETNQTTISLYERGVSLIPAGQVEKIRKAFSEAGVRPLSSPPVLQPKTAKGETKEPICETEPIKGRPPLPHGVEGGGVDKCQFVSLNEGAIEVLICGAVELGPETMKALGIMVRNAVYQLTLAVGPQDPLARARNKERLRDIEQGNAIREKAKGIIQGGGL